MVVHARGWEKMFLMWVSTLRRAVRPTRSTACEVILRCYPLPSLVWCKIGTEKVTRIARVVETPVPVQSISKGVIASGATVKPHDTA